MGMMDRVVEWEPAKKISSPQELSDTQILDFLNEYAEKIEIAGPTAHTLGGFTIHVWQQKTYGKTLREAACKAAERWEAINS